MANANHTLCGIYKILNKINGKVYIGSSANIKSRWRAHVHTLKRGTHHSAALQRAWNKYGKESFEFSVIEIVQDHSELLNRETYYLQMHQSANGRDGYNSYFIGGSAFGYKHSEETKKRMSEGQKKIPYEVRLTYCRSWVGKKHSEETKLKMSLNSKHLSPTPWQREKISKVHKGKTLSQEHRAISAETCRKRNITAEHIAKVSRALKGKPKSDAHKAALSLACKGRIISEEQKQKIRQKLKGRIFSDEHRAKISAALRAKKNQTV